MPSSPPLATGSASSAPLGSAATASAAASPASIGASAVLPAAAAADAVAVADGTGPSINLISDAPLERRSSAMSRTASLTTTALMPASAPRPTSRPMPAMPTMPAFLITLRLFPEASKQLKPQRDDTQKSTTFSTAGGSEEAETHGSRTSKRRIALGTIQRDVLGFIKTMDFGLMNCGIATRLLT